MRREGRGIAEQDGRARDAAGPFGRRQVVTLSPQQEVTFGDTKEGMFAIRVATGIEEEKGGKLVNGSNKVGEKNGSMETPYAP